MLALVHRLNGIVIKIFFISKECYFQMILFNLLFFNDEFRFLYHCKV